MENEFIYSIFNKIIGLKTRNVKLGYGSFITMDFGADIEIQLVTKKGIRKRKRGEWYLWIYQCNWCIVKNNQPIIGSDDERKKIEEVINIVNDKKLLNFSITSNTFSIKLEFEENIILNCFSNNTEELEQWMLFTPEGKVLVAGPYTNYSYKSSEEEILNKY